MYIEQKCGARCSQPEARPKRLNGQANLCELSCVNMKGFRCQVVKPTPGEREVTQDSRAAEERRLARLPGPPLFVGRVLGADSGSWSSIPACCKNCCFTISRTCNNFFVEEVEGLHVTFTVSRRTGAQKMGNAFSPAHHTYAVVGVELRRHKPFIGSLRNAHEHVPLDWNFHLFHMNFSSSPQSHRWWLPGGEMGRTIREFKDAGRRVYTHVYPDAWHSERIARRVDRTGNLYPRKAEFWSTMTEDRIMTVEADTAFCGATRFTHETFSRFPYLGAPTHVRPPSYSADHLHPVLNGGFSLRSRRAMLECIEWAQRKVRGHSVKLLWDKSVYRNEDLMYSKCLIQAEMRLRYPLFPTAETAWQFSCEHGCYHRMTRGAPVPWGIHDLCRDLIQYGGCSARDGVVNSAGVANYITGGVDCTRAGFNLPEAFSAFERYCGSDLQYMAYKCLKLNASSGAAIDEGRIIHTGKYNTLSVLA